MVTRMTPVVHAWDDGHRIEPTTHEYRVSPNVDLSLSGLTDYYGGLTDAFPAQQTAAAVFAMSMVSRAFASAEVRPATFAQTLSAPVRAMIGLELLLRGEFLAEIDLAASGRIILYPGYGKVASGTHRPDTWRYELKLAQPGDDTEPITRNVAANGVVHVRDGADVLAPWKGYSRLQRMGVASQALADIEGRLGHDARTRVMHIIPVPDGIPAARVTDVGNSLRASRGNVKLVETTTGGWGQGRLAAPSRDWEPRRVGPEIPQQNTMFRDSTAAQIIAAMGVPQQLQYGAAGEMREGYRQLQTIEIEPLARLVEAELSEKLETDIRFTFDRLAAIDINARARAFQGFINGGLTLEAALSLVGLELPHGGAATPAGSLPTA